MSKRKPPARRSTTTPKTVPFKDTPAPRSRAAVTRAVTGSAAGRSSSGFPESRTPNPIELGVSGTRLLSGITYEETNVALQGMNGFRKYHEMRFDPTCAALLRAYEYPVRAARHFVEPSSDDPKDIEKADFIHDQLYEFGSQSMDDILRLAFGMMPFGFAWSEICYAFIESGPWAGKWGWDKFAWRSQATKWRWNTGEVDGRQELVSVTQLAPPFYQSVDIPRDKLLIWTNEQEGDNFDGWSALRAAYKPYTYRDLLYRIQAIGLERGYMGIPVAKLMKGYSNELRTLMQTVIQNLRTDEQAGVVIPEDVDFQMIFNRLNGDAMQKAITHHDTQIVAQGLADFLKLGTADVGSFALSSDKTELFLYALNGKANYFDQVLNLDPGIPLLIRYNFADADRSGMPKLAHGDIGQRALERMGRTLDALAKNGFLTPDDPTEDKLRQMLDLPERDSSITERALQDLIQEVFPTESEHGRLTIGDQSRLRPNTLVPPPGDPGAPPGPDSAAEGAGEFSERRLVAFKELQRMTQQRPWRRPQRISDQRAQIQMSEVLIDTLEDVRAEIGAVPERPSIAMAKRRRPYQVLGFAEPRRTRLAEPAPSLRHRHKDRLSRHTADLKRTLQHVGQRAE